MKKVVIIDDSASQLYLMKTHFSKNDWIVETFQDSETAYNEIFNIAPDLIITDAIMPRLGGFQLIKLIRNNSLISEIPTIVYSVLSESNAKFYIKKEKNEFYLTKSSNLDELLNLAKNVVRNCELSDEYKERIINSSSEKEKIVINTETNEIETIQEIDPKEEITKLFQESHKYIHDDNKFFEFILDILNKWFKFDLCTIALDLVFEEKRKVYFDIRNIIISPIFQSNILKKYSTKEYSLYKKYAPNSNVITSENDFGSKFEFEFKYNNETIAIFEFYSKQQNEFENKETDFIRDILSDLLKTRHLNNKYSQKQKPKDSYHVDKISFDFSKKFEKNENETYFAIINIKNYKELSNELTKEDFDRINSKISERIISFLDKNEKINKNYNDEYILIIYAKDDQKVQLRLDCILNAINSIKIDENKVIAQIAANNCIVEGNFNIYEAQKNARKLLDMASTSKAQVG